LTVSPDRHWLVTVAHRSWYREEKGLKFENWRDGVVDLWDLARGKRVRRLVESEGTFRSATFTADGRVVLFGGGGTIPAEGGRAAEEFKGEIALLDPIAARWVRSFTPPPPPPLGVTARHWGATVLSPDGRTLYVSYSTGDLVRYEVATGQIRQTVAAHRGHILALAFSPDSRQLISGSHDGTALVRNSTLAAAAKPRKELLTDMAAEDMWAKATGSEAQTAFTALAELSAAPEQAIKVLRRHVKPLPAGPTDTDLARVSWTWTATDSHTREGLARASRIW